MPRPGFSKREATYEDLMQIPDHMVAEILDGELYVSPRPAVPHALAASVLGSEIGRRTRTRRFAQNRSTPFPWNSSGSGATAWRSPEAVASRQAGGRPNRVRALPCAIFRRSFSLMGARSIHAAAGIIVS